MTPRPAIGERVFAALLRLLPREFRGDYGEAMAADFDERRAAGERVVWRRELPSLLAAAVREHAGVLRRDVHYALRTMRRTPGFTALAVLMLAMGTGANVAMFSVVDAVMLRSPFVDPERLVTIRVAGPDGRMTSRVPTDRFEALTASPRSLAAVGAVGGGEHLLTGRGDPQRLDFECITPSMFDVLGTRPLMGRVFSAAENRPGAAPTIVLSHTLWQTLGGSSEIVGRSLTLNETPVTVVGVMPRGFDGVYSRSDTSGWLPVGITLKGAGLTGCRLGSGVSAVGRIRDGLDLQGAEAALPGIQLLPLDNIILDELRTPLLVLSAAVACVLLIACLNVGGLQIERAVARRREMALRLALGASRGRLVRQTLTENAVLACAGAAAGVAATTLVLRTLISLLPANLPHLDQIAVNGRVLAMTTVAAAAAALVAGLVPLVQTRDLQVGPGLNDASRTSTRRNDWTRRIFVTAEVALSVVVLIGAGLMIQTFLTLRPSAPGFDTTRKITTLVRVPGASPDASERFFSTLFERLRTTPGITGVTGSSYLPMGGTVAITPVQFEGQTINTFGAVAMPEYFDLMKIAVTAGRPFAADDRAGAVPVAIVNEVLARRLRPDGNVVGQWVSAPGPRRPGEAAIPRQIVGVIANTRSTGADTRPRTEFYVPFAQNPTSILHVFVQTAQRDGRAATDELRRALRTIDPALVIEPIEPLRAILDRRVDHKRFGAWLLGAFALMALGLAGVGLMMTMGWWVSQRTREIGVRVALGASRIQLVRLVLRQGMALGAAGIGVGCLAAVGVTRYLEGWIYGVTPLDAATFAGAAALMLVIAAGAIYVPTRRAIRVDPVVALRAE